MVSQIILKKWGNSLAIIIPREIARQKNLSEDDRVSIEIFKEADFDDVFGSLKTNSTGQEFKDEAKKGWKD